MQKFPDFEKFGPDTWSLIWSGLDIELQLGQKFGPEW